MVVGARAVLIESAVWPGCCQSGPADLSSDLALLDPYEEQESKLRAIFRKLNERLEDRPEPIHPPSGYGEENRVD